MRNHLSRRRVWSLVGAMASAATAIVATDSSVFPRGTVLVFAMFAVFLFLSCVFPNGLHSQRRR
jgi:fucose permease